MCIRPAFHSTVSNWISSKYKSVQLHLNMAFYIPEEASQDVRDYLVLHPPTIAHGFQMLLGKAGVHLTARY